MPRLRTEAPADDKTGATKTDTIHEVFDIANDKSFFFWSFPPEKPIFPAGSVFPPCKNSGNILSSRFDFHPCKGYSTSY